MNDLELKIKEPDYFGSWVLTIVIFSLMTYIGGIVLSSIIMVPLVISSFFSKTIIKLMISDKEILIEIGDDLGLKRKNFIFKPNDLTFKYRYIPDKTKGAVKELVLYNNKKVVGKVNENALKIKKLDFVVESLKELGLEEKKGK